MKRIPFLAAALLAGFLFAHFLTAQEKPATHERPLIVEPAKKPAAKAAAVGALLQRDFSLRRARQLGLNSSSIKDATAALKASGDIVEGETSYAEAAVLVAEHIKASRGDTFSGILDLEWEAIFAFIERILKLFNLI